MLAKRQLHGFISSAPKNTLPMFSLFRPTLNKNVSPVIPLEKHIPNPCPHNTHYEGSYDSYPLISFRGLTRQPLFVVELEVQGVFVHHSTYLDGEAAGVDRAE